ncbi:calcium-binding protein [Albimonas sp. CAU 1670]|uniref:calcium-binding protein n=1 Tax=Albimonas sp. CAU 1670 TaxID=3032599 RepID=UPI0023DB5558|nr:calcium-binding protein [Albimonas sp. CAU 1670]MDF2231053.1 calcium-binding protein [Albimonas sp. CAU 1670]
MGKGKGKKQAVIKLFEGVSLADLVNDGLVQGDLRTKDISKKSLLLRSETVDGLELELSGAKIKYNAKQDKFVGGKITDLEFTFDGRTIATFSGVKIPVTKLEKAVEKAADGKWKLLDKLFNATAIKVEGSDGDDDVFGSKHADKLFGGAGADVLTGDKGKDLIDGGDGLEDRVDYMREGGKKGVDVNLTTGKAKDTYGNQDTLANIEEVIGTRKDDRIIGNDAENYFILDKGDDYVDGKGSGFNQVGYHWETGGNGIVVDLAAGTATDTYGDTDTLVNINVIRGSEWDDVIEGSDANEVFRGLRGDDSMDGRGGVDEVRYDRDVVYGGTSGVYVNLADGTATDGFGDTDTLANIENVRGTNFDDMIIGDAGDNRLRGYGDDDMFVGGAGDDEIDGGVDSWDEYDMVDYRAEGGGGGVNVNLATGVATDTFGDTDTLISIEEVRGTDQDDVMVGNAYDNWFELGAGDDSVDGGAGAFDQVAYHSETGGAGVSVDLALGTATDTYGDTDTIANIEGVRGSRWDDTILGDDADNTYRGLAGDDTLDGRGGEDEVRYDRDAGSGGTAGVTVNLALGTATDGFGDTDTLISIENVRGSDFADTIIGDAGANRIEGLGGDDILTGGAGADLFRIRSADLGTDTITDFDQGVDKIRLDFVSDFSELTIVENADHAMVFGPDGFSLRIEGDSFALSATDFGL